MIVSTSEMVFCTEKRTYHARNLIVSNGNRPFISSEFLVTEHEMKLCAALVFITGQITEHSLFQNLSTEQDSPP